MKTLVQFETKVMDRGSWLFTTTVQRGESFESIVDAREALSAAGFQLNYSVSRCGPNEVYFRRDDGVAIEKAVLIK